VTEELLLGSVTKRVLEACPCDVLVVVDARPAVAWGEQA
jgi:nucleotide-binding universal stress UspA family protein